MFLADPWDTNLAFWNVDNCGNNYVNDYFQSARAHGNSFTVYYWDGRWDFVDRWTSRNLDPNLLATRIWVNCP